MSFRDCLISAVEQGAISREEAAELQRRFDAEFAQARLSLGDDAAAAAAKSRLEAELRAEGIEARRRVLLQDAAQDRLAEYVGSYRGLDGKPDIFAAVLNLIENHGYAGTSSLIGRQKAIVSLVHGQIADVLSTFRKSLLTGRRVAAAQGPIGFDRKLVLNRDRRQAGQQGLFRVAGIVVSPRRGYISGDVRSRSICRSRRSLDGVRG